jgi:hypothetical protein
MAHRLAVPNRPPRRPLIPPAGQTARPLAVGNRRRHGPLILLARRMVRRLAIGNRPWPVGRGRMVRRRRVGNRPPGLRGGWRGSRDSRSTVQRVRTSRRVGPDGRPWMPPGGRTPRWTPPSTGRRARRRFGPGRCARRDPGRVSGPPPTRAVASSARPPTLRPRDPADGPRALRSVRRPAATSTRPRPRPRRRRDPARGR